MDAKTDKKKNTTTIRVSREMHRELKIKAAKEAKQLEDIVDEVLKKGLKDD